jgi:tetratricopeptide (TPR) repeat protein
MNERDIFIAALHQQDPAERAALLDRACGEDRALRERVEELLRVQEQLGSFMERPAEGVAATGAFFPAPREQSAGEGPGTVIGPYKLVQEIGEGGMGTVWMAQQTEPVKRLVALKVIKLGMDSRQVITRFEVERQALALMDHPNIARVFDAGTTANGRPYFVMELVKGVPITKYCDEHRLTPRQRLELFIPVCQAIQHAHQKGIIHRDIKPSNVLIASYDGRPVPKVIDFGVAKATGQQLTEHTLVTGFGTVVGTLEYMSPEQAELNQLDIDTRSDIYSLGVLVYELLTGTTPLEKKRLKEAAMLELLRVIREEEPPRPSTRLLESKDTLPSISAQRQMEPAKLTKLVRGELDWIVMKALEKDRNRRYETANGFAADVHRYLADEPVLACPPSGWYRFRKFARRNRGAVLTAVAALVLVVVAGAGIWSWQHQQTLRGAEKAFHAELTRRSVEALLEQIKELHRRALWQQADNLLEQAEQQLGPEGDPALRDQVAQARRHTAFLKRLDKIRLDKSALVKGWPSAAGALAEYPKAFLENGFDVVHGDPGELAAKLKDSEVRDYLLAALDDWAMEEGSTKEGRDRSRRIMAITADATGQAWRGQLGASLLSGNGLAGLYDLYNAIPENERTPAIIIAAARQLGQDDGNRRLESGLRQYPSDFWLHFEIGSRSSYTSDRCIGAFRAALAIRPETPFARYNLGVAMRAKKEDAAAIAEFRAAIRLDPNYVLAHYYLGMVLHHKKEYDAASAAFKEAIRLDPKWAYPHDGLGTVLHAKKDYEGAIAKYKEAIRLFKEAIRLDSEFAVPHSNLGYVLYDRKEYDAAIAKYEEAIRINPKFAAAHNGLGNVLRQKNKYDAASAKYKEAIRLDPSYAPPHNGLGNLLYDRKEYDAAIAEYKEAIRLDPSDALPHIGLGNVLYDRKEYDAASAKYKEAIRLDSEFAEPHSNLGNVLREKKEYDAAIAEYKEAIRLDPKLVPPHIGLGNVLYDRKEYDAASGKYEEAIRLDPNSARAHNGLGIVLHEKKEYAGAIAEYKKAIRLDPKLVPPHIGLGNVLREKKEYAAAIAEYKEAIRLDPSDALPHHGLGNWLYDSKEYAAAIAEYKEAIRLDPKSALPHYGRGNALRAKGRVDEAIAAYREAILLNKDFAEAHCNLALALQQQGKFRPALEAMRRGDELGRRNPRWPYPSPQWLRNSERLVELDEQIIQGKARPANPTECVEVAQVCSLKRLHGAAARFYKEALAAPPMMAHRYNAACAAALAGCGQGDDADKLDDKARAGLRRQALDWLRADLDLWRQLLSKEPGKAAPVIVQQLGHWLVDTDFAGVRGAEALARLPEAERQPWQKLWDDVADTLKRAQEKAAPEKKADPK